MTTTPAMFQQDGAALLCRHGAETIRVEAWGVSALRVRARPAGEILDPPWGQLLPAPRVKAQVAIEETYASITVGKIRAELRLTNRYGADVKNEIVIRFVNSRPGAELLCETRAHFAGPAPRAYKAKASDSWAMQAQFAAY